MPEAFPDLFKPPKPPRLTTDFGLLYFTERDAKAPEAPAEPSSEEAETKEEPIEGAPPPIVMSVVSIFHPTWGVKSEPIVMLGPHLDASSIEPVAPAIVAKLDYPDYRVRVAALEALAKLEPAMLEPFADDIARKLVDHNESVRQAAQSANAVLESATRHEDDDYLS